MSNLITIPQLAKQVVNQKGQPYHQISLYRRIRTDPDRDQYVVIRKGKQYIDLDKLAKQPDWAPMLGGKSTNNEQAVISDFNDRMANYRPVRQAGRRLPDMSPDTDDELRKERDYLRDLVLSLTKQNERLMELLESLIATRRDA